VQLEFIAPLFRRAQQDRDILAIRAGVVPLRFVRNRFARRYILRVQRDNSVRVTIPRGGNRQEAQDFAERNVAWIQSELQRIQTEPRHPLTWRLGAEILFRGERVSIASGPNGSAAGSPIQSATLAGAEFCRETAPIATVQFADQIVPVTDLAGNLRPAIERHLLRLAMTELISRTWVLARVCQQAFGSDALRPLRRVTVRNQRSRWGSCSAKGTVSLNWRLIQMPPWVSDYLILHELVHLLEMNHSCLFWRRLEQVCPGYRQAEAWLKQNAKTLR
jgi:predicted metal-dependent hydrolase